MKQLLFTIVLSSLTVFCMSGCKSKQEVAAGTAQSVTARAPVIIYKMKQDYSLHVPVSLSADKKSLESYPAPSDVFYGSDLAYPIALENGFFLDRRGINANSAFTKWTYYEYSRLSKTPAPDEIMKMILDSDPFTEIYSCGDRGKFHDLENELNSIIIKGDLDKFKRLK